MVDINRVHDRVDVGEGRIDAVLRHQGEAPHIAVMNLSRTGAAFMADEPIGDVPQRAELCMRPAGDAEWVTCPCELRYILGENRPDGAPAWLHGVRFVEVSEQVEAFIDRMLAAA